MLGNVYVYLDNVVEHGQNAGVLCNIGYPSETHVKPNSSEISFVHNLFLSYSIVYKFFFTLHGKKFPTIGKLKHKFYCTAPLEE